MLRVTSQLTNRIALREIQSQSANATRAQLQLSTGKRVHRPSDDPVAHRGIASLHAEVRRLDSELQSIASARGTLNMSLTRLTEARTLATGAKSAAQQGRETENRQTHADTVDSLLEQMVRLANDQSEGRYVFGGARPLKPPAEVERDAGGRITAVRLAGSERPLSAPIGRTFSVDTSLPARQVFGSPSRGPLAIVSRTGVQPGTGSDSARGGGAITVQHTATSYEAASGVLAGGSSAAGDTIVGPAGAHTLTLADASGTGAFGEVSLNGGPAVSFTSADTDLLVTGGGGEQVYLDLSAVTPGYNGTVDITASGTISTDGGATAVPLTFAANQQLVHGQTGETVNVDTTAAWRVGEDLYEHPGGADIFEVLIQLRDDLLGERELSESEFQEAVTRHIGDLDRLTNHLIDSVGEQAVSLENLDTAQSLSEDVKLEAQVSLGSIEGADIPEAVLALQSAQQVLENTYAATAQMFRASLLDYL